MITILPSVVGQSTVKRHVAGSKLVADEVTICILLVCSRGLCGYPGKEYNCEKSRDGHTKDSLPLPT
jgi:hypothetical protein